VPHQPSSSTTCAFTGTGYGTVPHQSSLGRTYTVPEAARRTKPSLTRNMTHSSIHHILQVGHIVFQVEVMTKIPPRSKLSCLHRQVLRCRHHLSFLLVVHASLVPLMDCDSQGVSKTSTVRPQWVLLLFSAEQQMLIHRLIL
jgi:hypothetical protein